jgi:hypothetical protein
MSNEYISALKRKAKKKNTFCFVFIFFVCEKHQQSEINFRAEVILLSSETKLSLKIISHFFQR